MSTQEFWPNSSHSFFIATIRHWRMIPKIQTTRRLHHGTRFRRRSELAWSKRSDWPCTTSRQWDGKSRDSGTTTLQNRAKPNGDANGPWQIVTWQVKSMAIDAGVRQFVSGLGNLFRRWFEPQNVRPPLAGAEFKLDQCEPFNAASTEGQPTIALTRAVEAGTMDLRRKRLIIRLQSGKRKLSLQPGGNGTAAIESGDFSINLSTRAVKVRGHELQLTSAEFEMLVFLTGHHKSVVTPNTMLATNWSGREVRQAEFVRVLVSLRKKLDSVSGSTPSYIRTESWIFYNFNPTLAYRPRMNPDPPRKNRAQE